MDNPPETQLNIFITPEMTRELKLDAERETENLRRAGITRKAVTKSGLAFEVLSWGYAVYKQVGSLAELKKLSFQNAIHGTDPYTFPKPSQGGVVGLNPVREVAKQQAELARNVHGKYAKPKHKRNRPKAS